MGIRGVSCFLMGGIGCGGNWVLLWWTDSFEKTLMLGKIEGRRRRG